MRGRKRFTPDIALLSPGVVRNLLTLRELIALQICEHPDVKDAVPIGHINWDPDQKYLFLPILVLLDEGATLPLAALQEYVDEVSQLYLKEVDRQYHGVVRIKTSTR